VPTIHQSQLEEIDDNEPAGARFQIIDALAGSSCASQFPSSHRVQRLITLAFVVLPAVALAWAVDRFWNHGIGWLDIGLSVGLYIISGLGITLGFHRLFTHRGFHARRGLRIGLAIAGSLALEGSLVSWVSLHRQHHRYSDDHEDPHSPYWVRGRRVSRVKGLAHAHMGWLFSPSDPDADRWSRDLLADPDVVAVSALTPLWIGLSLLLPFSIGWAASRSLQGALLALLWAGGVRILLLHHMTWSVNSLGHMFGERPYRTKDRSTNNSWLAVVSFGDSWHNNHHAFPTMARHGCDPGQVDPAARILWLFERVGWAGKVKWPDSLVLCRRRVSA
jgi:stearoyl-CoA desaturase (Delta-9 desaturase)